ncbi:biopolymer transporter ExbB [Pararhodobacter sp.]|uniref:biopolymer transporter ExbB n=1 Tax=Pararhodobacter sp. TaxID=2127056 RepID=UPI002FDDE029
MARQLKAGALGPIGRVQFSQPVRQITLMLISLALVGAGVYIAFPRVSGIFFANIWLNGFIFLVFLIGVLATFWQVFQISSSVAWIEGFAAETPGHQITVAPRLLAPLAALLRSRGKSSHISATSTRSILESVATRIDEERDITRYLVNLLIFLGLLGTFYGLATSVPAVVETIRSLAPQEGQSALSSFGDLMSGLEAQMDGMGVAFSSSLLGLAGSLVVGMLELFASHGQNRFYRELEEWLSSITRLGSAASENESGEAGGAMGALVTVLDSMADQLEAMRNLQSEAEAGRAQLDQGLSTLAEAVDRLSLRFEMESSTAAALSRLADGQEQVIGHLNTMTAEPEAHIEAETRMRLRSMDVQLLRILEELSAGRQESIADLRTDLSTLTQAVRQLNRQPPPVIMPARDDEG